MQSGEAGTVHCNCPELLPDPGRTRVRSAEAQSGKAGKAHLWREGQSLATFARVGSVDWGSGSSIMIGW